MFQNCNSDDPKDREKIAKLLPYITDPEFSYILKSYIDVYHKEANTPIGKKLINMLDDFGVDVGHL